MNIIKKIQKKQKRKKLMRQKARLAQEQAAQEGAHYGRTSHRRRISRKGKKVITAAVIATAVCLVFLYAEKRSYHSYKVLNTSEQEDVHTVCGHGWRYPKIQSGWSICCGQQHEYDLE